MPYPSPHPPLTLPPHHPLLLPLLLLSLTLPLPCLSADPPAVWILGWTPHFTERPGNLFFPCAGSLSCVFTWNLSLIDSVSAFMLHAPAMDTPTIPSTLLNDSLQRPLYLYTQEPPHRHRHLQPPDFAHFDLVTTYELFSDAPNPYDLGLPFLDRVRALNSTQPTSLAAHLAKRRRAAREGRAPIAWFVSNCEPSRLHYVAELQRHIPVDVYSHSKCLGSEVTVPAGDSAEGDVLSASYFFYLSMENSHCLDYVTEKLQRPIFARVVPIVDGPRDYSAFAPTHHSLIHLDHYTPAQLAAHVLRLMRNASAYLHHLDFSHLSPAFIVANTRHYDAYCDRCQHAYTAQLAIQQHGAYRRRPTQYRYTLHDVCVDDKWKAQYPLPEGKTMYDVVEDKASVEGFWREVMREGEAEGEEGEGGVCREDEEGGGGVWEWVVWVASSAALSLPLAWLLSRRSPSMRPAYKSRQRHSPAPDDDDGESDTALL